MKNLLAPAMTPKKRESANKPNLLPPTQEEIVARAHRLWIEAGRPEGRDREHWAEAERQLSGIKPTHNFPSTNGQA
jgi:hypothetical protein